MVSGKKTVNEHNTKTVLPAPNGNNDAMRKAKLLHASSLLLLFVSCFQLWGSWENSNIVAFANR